ncbi:hypothetical protein FRB94_001647 [Tulasnella sp. JGI-2019a]|nr:hypothetical protein FRB94_001647 [Tulasnella sp. JGI-2019a]KAG9010431.1 hypothetical protein FRB93_004271 [Tulasnella sp. JGI-2019a]KAG9038723.1 hypothetical protein FRB95_000313 [Tulasnella sp. JGI-2019a]
MSTPSQISITHRPSAIFTAEVPSPTDVGRSHLSGGTHDEKNHIQAEKAACYPGGKLEYSVPKVVESLREGRRDSYNVAPIVAALLATVEAAMIVLIKTHHTTTIPALIGSASPTVGSANATTFLLILSYAGLILNTSTTFSSRLLIERLRKFVFVSKGVKPVLTDSSVRSACRLLRWDTAPEEAWHILEFYHFSTLLAGFLIISIQILTFIWISEEGFVAVIPTITALFCLIPFVTFFL